MAKVFCFDLNSKAELLREYLGSSKNIKVESCYDVKDAVDKIKKWKPDILIYGGDISSENWKATQLWYRLLEEMIDTKKVYSIISTWDADEAKALKGLDKKMFYCPFSESLANIVKTRARMINTRSRKNATKN